MNYTVLTIINTCKNPLPQLISRPIDQPDFSFFTAAFRNSTKKQYSYINIFYKYTSRHNTKISRENLMSPNSATIDMDTQIPGLYFDTDPISTWTLMISSTVRFWFMSRNKILGGKLSYLMPLLETRTLFRHRVEIGSKPH